MAEEGAALHDDRSQGSEKAAREQDARGERAVTRTKRLFAEAHVYITKQLFRCVPSGGNAFHVLAATVTLVDVPSGMEVASARHIIGKDGWHVWTCARHDRKGPRILTTSSPEKAYGELLLHALPDERARVVLSCRWYDYNKKQLRHSDVWLGRPPLALCRGELPSRGWSAHPMSMREFVFMRVLDVYDECMM